MMAIKLFMIAVVCLVHSCRSAPVISSLPAQAHSCANSTLLLSGTGLAAVAVKICSTDSSATCTTVAPVKSSESSIVVLLPSLPGHPPCILMSLQACDVASGVCSSSVLLNSPSVLFLQSDGDQDNVATAGTSFKIIGRGLAFSDVDCEPLRAPVDPVSLVCGPGGGRGCCPTVSCYRWPH